MWNLSGLTFGCFSSTFSYDLVPVQPNKSTPSGLLYYIDYKYESIAEKRIKKLKKIFGEELKELKNENG